MKKPQPKPRGFRALDPARAKRIQRKGGRSHSPEWMAEIGRRGGSAPRVQT